MSASLITAIAYLLSEVMLSGITLARVFEEMRKTGRIPPERWDEELAKLDLEAASWRAKRASRRS